MRSARDHFGGSNGRLSDTIEDATRGGDNGGDKLVRVSDQGQDQFLPFLSENGSEFAQNGSENDTKRFGIWRIWCGLKRKRFGVLLILRNSRIDLVRPGGDAAAEVFRAS